MVTGSIRYPLHNWQMMNSWKSPNVDFFLLLVDLLSPSSLLTVVVMIPDPNVVFFVVVAVDVVSVCKTKSKK